MCTVYERFSQHGTPINISSEYCTDFTSDQRKKNIYNEIYLGENHMHKSQN